MKRELKYIKRVRHVNGCCPGHDDFPDEAYRNRKSKRARSKGKKREHRYVRRIRKHMLARLWRYVDNRHRDRVE